MKSAVVGIGTIGPVHLDALTRLGEEIAALCDIRPERPESARYGKAESDPLPHTTEKSFSYDFSPCFHFLPAASVSRQDHAHHARRLAPGDLKRFICPDTAVKIPD